MKVAYTMIGEELERWVSDASMGTLVTDRRFLKTSKVRPIIQSVIDLRPGVSYAKIARLIEAEHGITVTPSRVRQLFMEVAA